MITNGKGLIPRERGKAPRRTPRTHETDMTILRLEAVCDNPRPTRADEAAYLTMMAPRWDADGDYDVVDHTCPRCGRWVMASLYTEPVELCGVCRLDDLREGGGR
jgi:hypothetical protein